MRRETLERELFAMISRIGSSIRRAVVVEKATRLIISMMNEVARIASDAKPLIFIKIEFCKLCRKVFCMSLDALLSAWSMVFVN